MRRKHSADRIYRYLQEFIELYRYAPTVRRIADDCGISSTSVVAHLLAELEAAGRIRRTPNEARTIVLTEEQAQP